ncbi:galactose oxidase [Hufsiella ginkgonis]|uniref:Galactose oxidase n=1 Tax=Hufsiella ginkgonis TaxID=2695274 RepID=A0A7K1Y2J3_9SPHI|nr:galactose oxidase [Hufsiella ginkgonis]MXV17229.1 galactose oxidase [Hufsiella ginkgonis]
MRTFLKYLGALAAILCCFGRSAYPQSYGLQVAGSEVVQDERTGIDLSPGGSLCLGQDFELSFDLGFVPDQVDYFGYIVRIIDSRKQNIDLIYDKDASIKRHLRLVMGEVSVSFPYNIDKSDYFNGWLKISFRYSGKNNLLTFTAGGGKYTIKLGQPLDDCVNIFFGANTFADFQTTDVPPMRLRDIGIRKNNKLKYHWPLDDATGTGIKDLVSGSMAMISNPQWIRQKHTKWKMLADFTVRGPVSVAFDEGNDRVYIVGTDSMYRYSVRHDSLSGVSYRSGHQNVLLGSQSYVNARNGKLYTIYIDQDMVSVYDPAERRWSRNFSLPDPLTNYWHYNKFYSPGEDAFYLFGGYGHFMYKNTLQRLDMATGKKSMVKYSGDFFTPRYLAGLGTTENGAYIIGGYGSNKGKQILKSRNLYDLLYYDRKLNRFKRIYELKPVPEDFVFGNSIVIDEKEGVYYGLVFPKHKFKSTLQLVKGSLSKPVLERLGDEIPFQFQDIRSYADLFYSKQLNRFVAASLYLDDNDVTHVGIFSLSSPALAGVPVRGAAVSQVRRFLYPAITVLVLLAAGLFFYYTRRKKSGLQPPRLNHKQPADTQISNDHTPVIPENGQPHHANIVYLFGDFQIVDKDGTDITRQFTPLVKELFLILLLYNLRWERGISSEKLKEMLWPDKSAESASNNRSVNIAKLKALLDRMGNCHMSNDTGTWRMLIDHSSIYIDYYDYLAIVRDKKGINEEKIAKLAAIGQRGNILANLNYEWLDTFKSETANEVTDTFIHFINTINLQEHPELIIQVASYIFNFDPVNEDAMILKCRALVHLGKHSLAKATFENFRQEYRAIYNEEFNYDFKSVLR